MIIPKLHYISQGKSPEEHLENIQKACTSGAELVQLQILNVTKEAYLKSAKEAREITSHFQTRLIVNGYYKIAKDIKADGVHLRKEDVCPSIAREYLYSWQIIGASASTLKDCETLINKEVDYICLEPFKTSTNKDDLNPVLGLNGYDAIIDALKTETPILGFGGITIEDVKAILKTGISGIADSEEITADFNLIRKFNQLLSASSTAEQRYTFD